MENAIDKYIDNFPGDVQMHLQKVRNAIRDAAPEAVETIKYAMPTYEFHGNLVHFAGYRQHIGLYPGPTALEAFKEEIAAFKNSKGAVQFPVDQPMPVALIQSIVKYCVKRRSELAEKKRTAKTCKNGHKFYKTSDCPTCPVCEAALKPGTGFLANMAAPARRALEQEGITTLKQLSKKKESELLALHGFGKASLPGLREALSAARLSFKS